MNGQYKLPTLIKTIYKFKTMTAFVIASDKSLEQLSNMKGVKNIWEDLVIQAPEPKIMTLNENSKKENNEIHGLTAVDVLHKQGYYGEGAKVGIIDTGLNYHHPAFGSCFKTPGCRVINGYDFTGDDGTTEKEDPDDNCKYHGTHVAGIVAGDDELFTGVAPKAQLGAYKVFPCSGGASESIIMRALEQAYHDGMDIVNLSLGSPSGWDMRPYSHLIDRLSELGLIVIASQGNSGAEGLFMGGSPSISKSAIAVASFNNLVYIKYRVLKFGNQDFHTEVVNEGTGSFKIAISSTNPGVNDGCEPYTVDFNGAAVLIKRGTCALPDKIENAAKAGAGIVLLYNNVAGSFSNGFTDDSLPIGAYMLTGTDGEILATKSGETIVISSLKYSLGSPTSGLPSDFSSYGPGSLLQLKPEAAGIGGNVFSALPLSKGKYGVLSGTSMSSPYISGVAALYIGKYGKTDPFTMKRLLMNNGEISDDGERSANGKTKNKDGVYSTIKQGAGLVNATKVMDNTVSANPPKLELGDQKWYSFFKRRTITISNGHTKSVKYSIKHIPAVSVTGKEFSKVTSKISFAKVIIPSSITIQGKSSKQISVNIIPPWLPNKEQWVYSGYFVITPQNGGFPINVPYMGYKGALKDVSILGNDGKFPNVITSGHLDNPFRGYHSSKDVITADFTANGTIVFQLRVFQPSPLLTIELYNAKTSKKMGYVHQEQAIPRTSSTYNPGAPYQYVHQIQWIFGSCIACYTESLDIGKIKWTAVADGEYFVKIIVSKPFNDGVESYTSPRIYINRQ